MTQVLFDRREHLRPNRGSSLAQGRRDRIADTSDGSGVRLGRDEPEGRAWSHVTQALHQPVHDHKGRDHLGDLRKGAPDDQADEQVAPEPQDAGPPATELVDEEDADEHARQRHQGEDQLPHGDRLEGLSWDQRVDDRAGHDAVGKVDKVVDKEGPPGAQDAEPVSLEDKSERDFDRLC